MEKCLKSLKDVTCDPLENGKKQLVADQFADYPIVLMNTRNELASLHSSIGPSFFAQIVSALQETNELAVNYQLLDYEKALRIRKPRNVAM